MLIIFKKDSGEVVENQGIIDGFPLGLPNHDLVIEKVIERIGGSVANYDVIRLDDEVDKIIVYQTFTHEYSVKDGKIVIGNIKPIPEPEPPKPSIEDRVAMLEQIQNDNLLGGMLG